jgi:hypothetical protein
MFTAVDVSNAKREHREGQHRRGFKDIFDSALFFLFLLCFFLFLPCFCLFLPCYFFCDAPELSVSIRRSEATHPAQLTCHVAQPAHNQRFQNEIDWTI